ncbi:MAG: AMP-dependent synthetase [Rhodospirillales bacterium]|nr:MAG: AMP-dependent synthetase [Rhodospirillales bacterium]
MLKPSHSYEEALRSFHWHIPERYNIGTDAIDKHCAPGADANRTALITELENGEIGRYSFADLKRLSDCLANAMRGLGVQKGDRVAILLAQSVETALAHIAVYKLGAIAVPMFTLFGEDALLYRLADSAARLVVTDVANLDKVMSQKSELPRLDNLLVVGAKGRAGVVDFWAAMMSASEAFTPEDTLANDPALIIYTSGTTGSPKGALHAHRTLLGHLPGVEFPHDFFPKYGDLFWTPADWAWIGGLLDVLLPAWHHGVPVLAHRARKFDPDFAMHLMARHGVRNVFLPPTALKLMRQAGSFPAKPHLRSIGSGGETLGEELQDWGRQTFGVTINEFYGQTECNLVVGNCASVMEVRKGSMGRAIPGHTVEIVDDEGNPQPPGTPGNIAILKGDPVMFLEYWQNPDATAAKFAGDWLLTGDTGTRDIDGYFWFQGRADDVITSGAYRIGPGEIEDCLLKHPAVAMAAVIGVPDPVRTESIKAFIVAKPGQTPKDAESSRTLADAIRNHVKTRLAQHAYPREIEFVGDLPMTATGKIKRKDLREMEKAKRTSER